MMFVSMLWSDRWEGVLDNGKSVFNKICTGIQYVELPRVGADPLTIRPMGNSFSEFVERLSTR
jgi:hypothetical protein